MHMRKIRELQWMSYQWGERQAAYPLWRIYSAETHSCLPKYGFFLLLLLLFKMYQVFIQPVQEEIFWCLKKETSKWYDLFSMIHDYICCGFLWLVSYLSKKRNLELNGKNPVCLNGELVILQCLSAHPIYTSHLFLVYLWPLSNLVFKICFIHLKSPDIKLQQQR